MDRDETTSLNKGRESFARHVIVNEILVFCGAIWKWLPQRCICSNVEFVHITLEKRSIAR